MSERFKGTEDPNRLRWLWNPHLRAAAALAVRVSLEMRDELSGPEVSEKMRRKLQDDGPRG
jgi:hypothetical protein